LLAVPVFYSFFEDMKELKFFRMMARRPRAKGAQPVPEGLTARQGMGAD
jgi:hypothetical protein